MKIEIRLFGAFRSFDSSETVALEMPADARVGDLRSALDAYGRAHWPAFQPALLSRSVFASDTCVLRDGEALPADGRMAILPPVSGG